MVDVATDLHKRHSQVAALSRWGKPQESRIEHGGDSGAMGTFIVGVRGGQLHRHWGAAGCSLVVDLAEKHGT